MHAADRFALADGSYQHNLLRDAARLGAYAEAIAARVRPGDVVADLGSGSGVLASVAVRAGACRVHAVEAHGAAHATLQQLVADNGLAEAVVPTLADAETWVPPEPVDVALCELMETGLLHEPMAAAVRRIHRAWPARPRAIVPRAARLMAEAVALEDTFHGYHAPMPGFRAEGSGRALTDAVTYLHPDFEAGPPPEGVDARFALRVRSPGRANALRLRTVTEVAAGIEVETGPGYCTPVVLPLPEPLAVEAGQELRGRLRYTFAFDEEPLRYALEA